MTRQRALVVIAHPDDEVFVSGTICFCTANGIDVTIVCVTDGSGGDLAQVPARSASALAAVRERELKASADALGASGAISLGFADALDPRTCEPAWDRARVVTSLGKLIREHSPALILTHGPAGGYGHPAHSLVFQCVMQAAYDAEFSGSVFSFAGRVPGAFFTWQFDDPSDVLVDARSFIERRVASLSRHQSQISFFLQPPFPRSPRKWASAAYGYCFRLTEHGRRRVPIATARRFFERFPVEGLVWRNRSPGAKRHFFLEHFASDSRLRFAARSISALRAAPSAAPARRRPRVLHVIGALGVGGAETWLMELLRFWSAAGPDAPELEFLVTSGRRDHFDAEVESFGATIHYVPYGLGKLYPFTRRYRRILREGDFSAIHDHADYVSGWHFFLGERVLPPVRVSHVHNAWLHIEMYYAITPRRQLSTAIGKKLVDAFATDVCGTSAAVLRTYGFEPSTAQRPRVSVVHCGFRVDKFNAPREADRSSVLRELDWPLNTRLVLFVGRLDEALDFEDPSNHKNSWFALNVVRELARADGSVRFLMVGAGDAPRRRLQARIEEWGMAGAFCLAGVRDDVPRLMRAADALLFPSRQEGLGMVAVEAQAAGLPVLASTAVPRECVVLPELYDSLELAEPIAHWAETLARILARPRVSIEKARRAIQASDFTIEASAGKLERIYRGERP